MKKFAAGHGVPCRKQLMNALDDMELLYGR
jgi:hypothetical protein